MAARLRGTHPEVGVVAMSAHSDPAYALALLEGGSEGRAYLLTERLHSRAQLLATIDYLLVSLETLPLKLTRLQLLRVEATDYQPTDDPAFNAAPLFNDLEAIEEVFVQSP